MKKVIVGLVVVAGVLTGCDNPSSAGDKFVGTWSSEKYCHVIPSINKCSGYQIIKITKNKNGDNYTVNVIGHSNAYQIEDLKSEERDEPISYYQGHMDGDVMITDRSGKPIQIVNNKLEFSNNSYDKVN